MNKQCDFEQKILVLGDSGVGKSSLMLRFCDQYFAPKHILTIGLDYKTRFETIDGKRVKIQIWDTAGQERFRTLARAYYRGAHGIVMVYDLTSRDTFKNVCGWMHSVKTETEETEIILVGNKADEKERREVTIQEGKDLAETFRCLGFWETSAKYDINVVESFLTFGRLLLRKMRHQPLESPRSGSIIKLRKKDKDKVGDVRAKCCDSS